MGKIYFAGGINGVGKSSVLKEVCRINPKFRIFNGSRALMKRLKISNNYKLLESLNNNLKNKVQEKLMLGTILKWKKKRQHLIVDAHFYFFKKGKPINVVGKWISKFDGLFLIYSSPSEILKRIQKDEKSLKRLRDIFPDNCGFSQKINNIKKYLKLETDLCKKISSKYSIPFFMINNQKGELKYSSKEILKNIDNE